jgi:hypothetical protein
MKVSHRNRLTSYSKKIPGVSSILPPKQSVFSYKPKWRRLPSEYTRKIYRDNEL